MAHSIRLWLETPRYRGRIPAGLDILCINTVLQTVQVPGVCSAVYGTVLYEEPLKSFVKSRAIQFKFEIIRKTLVCSFRFICHGSTANIIF